MSMTERLDLSPRERRIKSLMAECGHPNSMSLYQAFMQFANEMGHEARGVGAELDQIREILADRERTITQLTAAGMDAWKALSWIINYDSEDKALAKARDGLEAALALANAYDFMAMRAQVAASLHPGELQ
jgi:hypothetical protein